MHKAVEHLKTQIIEWNGTYPLDKEYREKRNISFGSKQHQELNQVDIYFDYLERLVYKEILEEAKLMVQEEEDFKNGKWLKDDPDMDGRGLDLFNKLKIGNVDSNIQIAE